MILSIQVGYFWKSYLITTVLVLQIIKVILTSSDNIHSIILISTHYTIITNTYQIRRLVWSITLVALDILALSISSLRSIDVVSIMRAVLRWLLSVNQCNTVNIFILVVIFVSTTVSPSDQLLFRSFQTHWPTWLCCIIWYIDIS